MTRYDKGAIMRRAWQISREAAAAYGGAPRNYLSGGLALAWLEARTAAAQRETALVVVMRPTLADRAVAALASLRPFVMAMAAGIILAGLWHTGQPDAAPLTDAASWISDKFEAIHFDSVGNGQYGQTISNAIRS